MSAYHIILLLSILLILSALFEAIASRIRIPTVLLLMLTGYLLKQLEGLIGLTLLPNGVLLLQVFGVIGLIFIVLEEALHLKIEREKFATAKKAFWSSLLMLFLGAGLLICILTFYYGIQVRDASLYAIPLMIMSSAVAIPSVKHLAVGKREFLGFETTFSDILGVLLFNYVLLSEAPGVASAFGFVVGFFTTTIISFIISLGILWLIAKMKSKARSVTVYSILLFFYSIGKIEHLSPLILILIFGLLLCNANVFASRLRFLKSDSDEDLLHQTRVVTTEFTFFIKTLFFILFGYSIRLAPILNLEVVELAAVTLFVIYALRFILLWFVVKARSFIELLVAPRGLITVVLFYSLPASLRENEVMGGVLTLVVLSTIVIMSAAIILTSPSKIDVSEQSPA